MGISLKEFERMCLELFKKRAELEEIQAKAKEVSDVLEELKSKVLFHMDENDMEKHSVKGHGLIYSESRFTVPTPKTIDDKKAFGKYLNSKGIFWEMMSVNSATLNSFFKTEQEAAIAEGNIDFKLPGIAEPSHVRTLRMRKG